MPAKKTKSDPTISVTKSKPKSKTKKKVGRPPKEKTPLGVSKQTLQTAEVTELVDIVHAVRDEIGRRQDALGMASDAVGPW